MASYSQWEIYKNLCIKAKTNVCWHCLKIIKNNDFILLSHTVFLQLAERIHLTFHEQCFLKIAGKSCYIEIDPHDK